MGNSLCVIRIEGNLGARKTRGNLPLPLFGGDLRRLQFAGTQKVITNALLLLPDLQPGAKNECEMIKLKDQIK